MATININKVRTAVEQIAEELGIDLTVYGNASPTKLILEALQASVQILQQTTQIALTEQNPLTATELQSKIGLAALVGLNPMQLMTASTGEITVQINGQQCTITQHARLLSQDNIDYYVVLPTETVRLAEDTAIKVKQGILKSMSFIATGDAYEAFLLQTDNYIDAESIEVYHNGRQLSVGFKLDEDTDCYIRPAYDGSNELLLAKKANVPAGDSINVIFADIIGNLGDNMQVDQYMTVKEFAYDGDIDVTDKIKVCISQPIIGGFDFEHFDAELTNAIMLNGHNNLVGTEAQLVNYLRKFKQYTIQSAKVSDGIFYITALRSIAQLMEQTDYWTACSQVDLRQADIKALNDHINYYDGKSLDMLASVKQALREQCRVNVNVNMEMPDAAAIHDCVVNYLLSRLNAGTYEVATLYRALIAIDGVIECSVSYDGNVNQYGTAVHVNPEAILLCTAANITVNGETNRYGEYQPVDNTPTESIIHNITAEQITDLNKQLSDEQ